MTTIDEIRDGVDAVMRKRVDKLKTRDQDVTDAIAEQANTREEIRAIMKNVADGTPLDAKLQAQIEARQAKIEELDAKVRTFVPITPEDKAPVQDLIKNRHAEINRAIEALVTRKQELKEEKLTAGFVDFQVINQERQDCDRQLKELKKERKTIMGYYAHVELG